MKYDEFSRRNGIINGGFSSDDIIDLKRLIDRLKSDHPVSRLLRGKLSPNCRGNIENYSGSEAEHKTLLLLLVDDFNRLIGGGSLFNPEDFRQVRLRRHTGKLLKKNPSGAKLVKANKLVLQDYFAVELRRAPGRGKAANQEHPSVHFEKSSQLWAVYVTLVEPRRIDGKMRSGFCPWRRKTRAAADAKCSDVDAQIFGQGLARQLSEQEVGLAKRLFWELLEPKHPDWISLEYLRAIIEHAEITGWHPPDANIPNILNAAKCFWSEHVLRRAVATQQNYLNMFSFLLARFKTLLPNQLTDQVFLKFLYGNAKVQRLGSSKRINWRSKPEPLWDVQVEASSERPWKFETRKMFIALFRKFKNWMHQSKDPETQERRNWCPQCQLENPEPPKQPTVALHGDTEDEIRASDPQCIRNPALTVPQIQAIINVAFVAFFGTYAPYFVHCLWCGSRVTETLRSIAAAFNWEDLLFSVPGSIAKPHKSRESEVYMNAFLMIAALRAAGIYTTKGLRPYSLTRKAIYILAGFQSQNVKAQKLAERERQCLEARGIKLPRYNWAKPYPRNSLRRTALSMHYKLFLNEKLTTIWGGNSPTIFKEYYKRLVTRKEAVEFWRLLPDILRNMGLRASLPPNHKLGTLLTKSAKKSVSKAERVMQNFQRHHSLPATAANRRRAAVRRPC